MVDLLGTAPRSCPAFELLQRCKYIYNTLKVVCQEKNVEKITGIVSYLINALDCPKCFRIGGYFVIFCTSGFHIIYYEM